MSPEKQRVAIAEACGWTKIRLEWVGGGGGDSEELVGIHPRSKERWLVPDYLADLNAMHEAEGVLIVSQWSAYEQHLREIQARDNFLRIIWHATAAHRAEAFLRTLGKWEQTP